jgi:hypothetical protein
VTRAAAAALVLGFVAHYTGGLAQRRAPRAAPLALMSAALLTALGIDLLYAISTNQDGDRRALAAAAVLYSLAAIAWLLLNVDRLRGGRSRWRRLLFLGYLAGGYVSLGLLGGWLVPRWPGWTLIVAGALGIAGLVVGGRARKVAEAPGWIPLAAAFLGLVLLLGSL